MAANGDPANAFFNWLGLNIRTMGDVMPCIGDLAQ